MQLLLRFDDLRDRGVVNNWQSLNRWIRDLGFPPGRLLGRTRCWTEAEVMEWFESRPTAKRPLQGRAKVLAGRAA
jgi:hypothetical protein